MKAAVLNALGSPLAIETRAEPLLGTGEVIVDVAASRVLAYANEVLSGERKYLMELPMVPGPGAIGRIRATGPDATRLRPGDWVYCDPTVRCRDNARSPDIALQGLTGGTEAGLRLQRYFHDGAWAEQMRLPTENAVPIGDIDEKDAGRWCALGTLLVPYGGFLAAQLQAGEIVLVNGATGSFGSAAVAVALGMGAQCVVATGRNEQALTELTQRFGARVRTVPMRLRARRPPARGQCRAGADRHPGGAAVRAGGADGRRRHARRHRPRTALPLDDAKLHRAARAMDVPAACGHPDGRPDPRGHGRPRSFRDRGLRSRPHQRGSGACRRQRRTFQNDGDRAAALIRLRR
jgi:hypothetical protein